MTSPVKTSWKRGNQVISSEDESSSDEPLANLSRKGALLKRSKQHTGSSSVVPLAPVVQTVLPPAQPKLSLQVVTNRPAAAAGSDAPPLLAPTVSLDTSSKLSALNKLKGLADLGRKVPISAGTKKVQVSLPKPVPTPPMLVEKQTLTEILSTSKETLKESLFTFQLSPQRPVAPTPQGATMILGTPSRQQLLEAVQVMHDFVSSSAFSEAAQLKLANEQLQHSLSLAEEQAWKHQEDMESMKADTALALQLQKDFQEDLVKMKQTHQAESSCMAEHRDAAFQAQAESDKLLADAICSEGAA